jgi:hypothetical protein
VQDLLQRLYTISKDIPKSSQADVNEEINTASSHVVNAKGRHCGHQCFVSGGRRAWRLQRMVMSTRNTAGTIPILLDMRWFTSTGKITISEI